MANAIAKKLKIKTPSGEKEIKLYDDYKKFLDYDGGSYIAVQTDTNKTGYIYCNSTLPDDATDHFATFVDKSGNIRYAYTQQQLTLVAVYTFNNYYESDALPIIDGVSLDASNNKHSYYVRDTDNGNNTTTRKLYVDKVNKSIKFGGYTSSSISYLSIDYVNTANITDMGIMFQGCRYLTSLDLSNFNTSQVTNMQSMFEGCHKLTSLDLSNFDTSKVTSMESIFSSCVGLTSLDLSNFNTSNVTNMSSMFSGCNKLTSLYISNFNTSKITNMYRMFNDCSSLTSLNLSNFNTSQVANMELMFSGCSSLTSLDLSKFDTSKVTNMRSIFNGCSSLTSLDLSNFNI